MDNKEQQIDNFFNHYSDVFNKAIKGNIPDIERTAELFSACFIAANPSGVNCGQNNETFRDAMQKGYAFYKNIGITSMEIVSKEITYLDKFHAMVKVRWKSSFTRKDNSTGAIEFENIYFIQTSENEPKVFAYITGDEQATLKENGLI
ncbi:MAG TPA: hypothetical protein VK484_04490 [Ferruginibacter sp.]|nr:hypothetical protein [Ferruginibacter sp.]